MKYRLVQRYISKYSAENIFDIPEGSINISITENSDTLKVYWLEPIEWTAISEKYESTKSRVKPPKTHCYHPRWI